MGFVQQIFQTDYKKNKHLRKDPEITLWVDGTQWQLFMVPHFQGGGSSGEVCGCRESFPAPEEVKAVSSTRHARTC